MLCLIKGTQSLITSKNRCEHVAQWKWKKWAEENSQPIITAAAAVVIIPLCEMPISIHICSAQALNQLTSYNHCCGNTANVHAIFISMHWLEKHVRKSRPDTRISMKRGSVAEAMRLFGPEHANSGVTFLTESLKAAGTKDTSVEGAGGRGVCGGREGGWRVKGSSLNAASLQEKIIVSSLPRERGVFLWPILGALPLSCTAWDVTVVCHNYFRW